MVDAHYTEPRLAALYDPLDKDRSDLEVYAAMAAEFGARSVLDIGCGTGTLACLLASRGLSVTGLDPALASLDIARAKPFGDRVRWVHGPADALPPMQADLATMTGNVAQVFITDDDNDLLYKVTLGGTLSVYAGKTGSDVKATPGPALASALGEPEAIAIDPATNNLFVSDDQNYGIRDFMHRCRRIFDLGG